MEHLENLHNYKFIGMFWGKDKCILKDNMQPLDIYLLIGTSSGQTELYDSKLIYIPNRMIVNLNIRLFNATVSINFSNNKITFNSPQNGIGEIAIFKLIKR